MLSSRRKCLSLVIGASYFLGVFSVSANLLQVLPELGDLERWAAFSLGGCTVGLHLSDDAYIKGDVAAAGNGQTTLKENAIIDGDFYYRSNAILSISGNATITGTRHNNQDSLLDNGLSEAINASDHAFALAPTRSFTSIKLWGNQSNTLSGAPGETVVLQLKNFMLEGNSTFTLQGTASTTFIINVSKHFSLSGNSKIVLSGGLQWDDVLFNVRKRGSDVTLNGNASLQGILMANRRTLNLSGHSIVTGEVIANKIGMGGNSRVIHPPITSP